MNGYTKGTNAAEPVFHIALRFLAYTAVIFAVAALLPWMVRNGSGTLFCEDGPVEWLQFACLGAIAAVMLAGVYLAPPLKHILLLLGCMAALALFRELDMILDKVIPFAGWKVGWLPLLAAAWQALRYRREFMLQARWLLSSRAFSLMWAGFIVTVAFGQFIGYEKFLRQLMGDAYARDYRRVIQETLELMGYLFVLFGAIEAVVRVRVILRRRREEEERKDRGIFTAGSDRRLFNDESFFNLYS